MCPFKLDVSLSMAFWTTCSIAPICQSINHWFSFWL